MSKIIQIIVCIPLFINGCEAQIQKEQEYFKSTLTEKRSIDITINNFIDSYNQFALKSFNTLIEDKEDNMLFSSLGVYSSLFSLYYSADGVAKEELKEVLEINENDSLMLSSYSSVIGDLSNNNNDKYKFIIGNSLWYQNQVVLSSEFNNKYVKKLYLELNATDFKNNPTIAAQSINSWVSDKTAGRIQNIISSSDISDQTRAILANTVMFDAEWLYKFDKSQTRKGVFYNSHNSIDSAYFMNQVKNFKYYENNYFKILDLPYSGGEFSLIVILPTEGIENNLVLPIKVFDILKAPDSFLVSNKVNVSFPKYSVANSVSCDELLKKMDVHNIFSMECELSNLFPDEKIFVNNIFQKNLLELNEERSVFTSSTMTMMSAGSIPIKNESIKEFIADHPYFIILLSKKYNLIISIGQVLTIN